MKLRTLSTRAHGILDLMVAPMLPLLPRLLGCRKTTEHLLDATALAATVSTLSTDFEVGLVKALPVKAHLDIDAATGALLLTSAAFCRGNAKDRASLALAGAYFLTSSITTKTRSSTEKHRNAQQRERAMAHHQVDTPMEEFARSTGPRAARQTAS